MIINSTNARRLVVEANVIYDTIIAEGCWGSLNQARNNVAEGKFSPADACLCAVAECRNPSPLQDIPDYRHLLESTAGITTDGTPGEMKRYFVAVFQQLTKIPNEFAIDPKIGYCVLASN